LREGRQGQGNQQCESSHGPTHSNPFANS
jgi:hypothetical protein